MAFNLAYAILADAAYEIQRKDLPQPDEQPRHPVLKFRDGVGGLWTVIATSDPTASSGYQGALVRNDLTGELVLMNRGTESWLDMLTDGKMGTLAQLSASGLPAQFEDAESFCTTDVANYLAQQGKSFSDLTIVGHSLGGSLSQYLGVLHPETTVIAFNPYGIGNIAAVQEKLVGRTFGNITNHVLENDFVSVIAGSKMLGNTLSYQPSPTLSPALSRFTAMAERSPAAQSLNNLAIEATRNVLSHLMGGFLSEDMAAQAGTPVAIDVHGLADIAKLSSEILHATNLLATGFLKKLFILGFIYGTPDKLTPRQIWTSLLSNGVSLANGRQAPFRFDPLTLDLTHDGLLTSPRAQGAYFDMASDGFAEKTGWVQEGDAFVVRDLNSNNLVDNGGELFGDQTLLANGARAPNGFAALAALESNSDGVFNTQDALWGNVKLWKDNGDGVTQEGELISFEDAGVQSISLGYTNVGTADASGNIIAQYNPAGALMADGTSVAAGSFLLTSDSMDTLPAEYRELTDSIRALPELIGSGKMYDLSQAMARDATLENLVTSVSASTDYNELSAQFEGVLLRWTGGDTIDPQSRGRFINAQRLAAVEAFYGQPFRGVDGPNPNENAAPILESAYQTLKSQLFAQFVSQAQLRDAWDAATVTWDAVIQAATVDLTDVASLFHAELDAAPRAENVARLALFAQAANTLDLAATPAFSEFQASFSSRSNSYDLLIAAGLTLPIGQLPAFTMGSSGDDTLTATPQALLFGLEGNDLLVGGSGNDRLVGGDGDDVLDGGASGDVLKGGAGDDVLGGTSDAERFGTADGTDGWRWDNFPPIFAGNDYEGGTGNDTLKGTYGTDTYRVSLGDGADTIIEPGLTPGTNWHGPVDQGADVLVFNKNITVADIAVQRVGNDLVLAHTNGVDKVTVQDWYAAVNSGKQLKAAQFADGTSWTTAQLSAMGCTVVGSEAADNLTGAVLYANTLDGAAGDDVLAGGTLADVLAGGAGNDILSGGAGADTLLGGAGNDVLDGGAGSDVLKGGAGDDVLGGTTGAERFGTADGTDWWRWDNFPPIFAGNDYEGGTGNDMLNGTYGTDTYRVSLGDGADTIIEPGLTPGTNWHGPVDQGADVLVFNNNITAADIAVQRVGNDLALAHTNGVDKVTVQDWYAAVNSGKQLKAAQFADGTSWTTAQLSAMGCTVVGSSAADVMQGSLLYANYLDGAGDNDLIAGGNLADILTGGSGDDALWGNQGDDLLVGGDGNDSIDSGAGIDVLKGGAGDDVLGGTSTAERYGTESANPSNDPWAYSNFPPQLTGNDYEGGTGNDTLNGTYGSDTYRYNLGDGADLIIEPGLTPGTNWHGPVDQGADVLVFGGDIAAADIAAQRVGNDLVLAHINGSDKVTVKDWYAAVNSGKQLVSARFADGTSWSTAQLSAMGCTVVGSAAADNLIGAVLYANTLDGAAGDDLLTGGAAADALVGGAGDDILNGGAGADTLLGGAGNDVLDGGAGSDVLKGGAGDDVLGATSGAECFGTADGADGWRWDNYPPLFTGNDYDGGAGNDTLNGTYGTDTYRFSLGDGADLIIEPGLTPRTERHLEVDQGADVLVFGSGIISTEALVLKAGNDLLLKLGTGSDQVTIRNWFSGSGYPLNAVQFADGTSWNRADIAARQVTLLQGTAENDALTGTSVNEHLLGGAGNDTLNGGAGADTLNGGTGNDTLYRTDGGAKSIVFSRGDGNDIVYDNHAYGQGALDTLRLGTGITAADIETRFINDDLLISIAGSTDSIRLVSYRYGRAALAAVQFTDGTSWSDDDLRAAQVADFSMGSGAANLYVSQALRAVKLGEGITPDNLIITTNSYYGLRLAVAGTSDTLDLWGGELGSHNAQQLLFADGTVWDSDAIDAQFRNTAATDGGPSYLLGTDTHNIVTGFAGDNQLYVMGDGITVTTGAGNDGATVAGGSVSMDLGAGINYVSSQGSLQYRFTSQGTTTITMWYSPWSPEEAKPSLRLELGAGVSATDLSFSVPTSDMPGWAPTDMVVSIVGHNGSVTLQGFFEPFMPYPMFGSSIAELTNVQFADGTRWSATDLLHNLLPAEAANGIRYGADNQVIVGSGAGDTLLLGASSTVFAGNGNNTIVGGAGTATVIGGLSHDYLRAAQGNSTLLDQKGGINILQGQAGSDVLTSQAGYDVATGEEHSALGLITGGAGSDTISADKGILAGNEGDDSLVNGGDGSITLFNRGDGQDTLYSWGANQTVSLGGGISYADVSLSRDNSNLVLSVGQGESISLTDWFSPWNSRAVSQLQLISEAMASFDASSANPLFADKVQQVDFTGFANAFEITQAQNSAITSYSLADHIAQFLSGSSNVEAKGGDIAYLYGRDGTLAGRSISSVQGVLQDPTFGQSQALGTTSSGSTELFKLV